MSTDGYEIEIKGEGVSISQKVAKEIGDQIIVLTLTGNTPRIRPSSQEASPKTVSEPESVSDSDEYEQSIREALDAYGAQRAPDKITVMGDFIKRTEGKDFDRSDIISMFEAAAEKVPANLPRDIKWTLKAGWIAERSTTKGSYYVTNTGKQALKAKFSAEFIKKTRLSNGTKKKSSSSNDES